MRIAVSGVERLDHFSALIARWLGSAGSAACVE
jgi:hypothetical protein